MPFAPLLVRSHVNTTREADLSVRVTSGLAGLVHSVHPRPDVNLNVTQIAHLDAPITHLSNQKLDSARNAEPVEIY